MASQDQMDAQAFRDHPVRPDLRASADSQVLPEKMESQDYKEDPDPEGRAVPQANGEIRDRPELREAAAPWACRAA